ncbi:hypothetical protein BH09VER1_BH09VER1_18910 [soil metagenome]
MDEAIWNGLKEAARKVLIQRNYAPAPPAVRVVNDGLDAGEVLASEDVLKESEVWIPGVELIHRTIYPQRHRGFFSELGREGEGHLGKLGLWPKQWAAARMFAGSAKGFHIHPPYIPKGESPESWFAKLFNSEEPDYTLRRYDLEQWDVMYFLQGRLDLILCDERATLPRRRMRLFIDGDDHRGRNNVAVIIPPGVAHALRAEGSEDLFMVYGTSTTFDPASEGRLASGVEELSLPEDWSNYLD